MGLLAHVLIPKWKEHTSPAFEFFGGKLPV